MLDIWWLYGWTWKIDRLRNWQRCHTFGLTGKRSCLLDILLEKNQNILNLQDIRWNAFPHAMSSYWLWNAQKRTNLEEGTHFALIWKIGLTGHERRVSLKKLGHYCHSVLQSYFIFNLVSSTRSLKHLKLRYIGNNSNSQHFKQIFFKQCFAFSSMNYRAYVRYCELLYMKEGSEG